MAGEKYNTHVTTTTRQSRSTAAPIQIALCVVTLLLTTAVTVTHSAGAATLVKSCTDAVKACDTNMQCGNAKFNMELGCNDIIYPSGTSVDCSLLCQRALVSLALTPEGYEWLSRCDCKTDHVCARTQDMYARLCASAFPRNATGQHPISCQKAEWICKSNDLCRQALSFHMEQCGDMIAGRRCTNNCNDSIAILYWQKKARYLKSCVCDGKRPQRCKNWKRNIDTLCFLADTTSSTLINPLILVAVAIFPVLCRHLMQPFENHSAALSSS